MKQIPRVTRAILAEIVREQFDEENYLKCECSSCRKLAKFHRETVKDVIWLQKIRAEHEKKTSVKEAAKRARRMVRM